MFHANKLSNRKGIMGRVVSLAKRSAAEGGPERSLGRGVPGLERHPEDGWVLAKHWPMPGVGRRALRTLIRLICPTEGPMPPDMVERVEMFVRRQMVYMHPILGVGLWMTPLLLDWSPLWMGLGERPLHRLERGRALKVLDALGTTRFAPANALLIGLRAAILAAYFDQDEVHEAMEYDPVPFIRSRMALRERITGGDEIHEDDMISS